MKTIIRDPLVFEVLGTDLGFTEGPVVTDSGVVFVVDIDGGRVLRLQGGAVDVVATPGGGPNGLALESPTTAIVANNGGFLWSEIDGGVRIPIDRTTHTNEPPGFSGGWLERVDLDSGEVTVLHRDVAGRSLRGPNDLVFDEVGGLWFTDHGKGRHASVDRGGLYYVPPNGSGVREMAFPLLGPNGVGLSPDGTTIYVSETHTGRLWAWDLAGPGEIRPSAGSLAVRHGGTCLAATPFSFDSLGIEADGRIVIGAIADGIVVITPDGEEAEIFPIPGDVTTNIAFGGAHGRRAVITLSRSGRVVETPWPRTGLVVRPPLAMTTAAEFLRNRNDDAALALCFEEQTWTYRQLMEEAAQRSALFGNLQDQERPPHIGVLLDNVPDYLFWLAAAAVSGKVLVGINSTYRGDQLGQLHQAYGVSAPRHIFEPVATPRGGRYPGSVRQRSLDRR